MSATTTILTATAANVKRVLTRPLADPGTRKNAMQDSSWADGLRGVASIFVVSSHMVLCVARRLVLPCCASDEKTVLLFQRPVFRLVAQGHAWVAIFFILSGFVNALKPIKLARAGDVETALSNLAVSSFRRSFRLALPAAAATVISWAVCQFGAYELARNSDAFWLYTNTPAPSTSWGTAVEDLFNGLRATWTIEVTNPYDQPQWALIYLLQGSMMIFTALLITINLTPFYRTTTLALFSLWSFDLSYKLRDPLVGFTTLPGILLSELSLSSLPTHLSPISPYLSPSLTLLALILMSQPTDFTDRAPWSAFLLSTAQHYVPAQLDYGRFYGSFGALLLVFAIVISPHLRAALSRPVLLWLGKLSFPIYLLHGTLMRSVFAWMMFAGVPAVEMQQTGDDGKTSTVMRVPLPGLMRTAGSVVVFSVLLLGIAHFWAGRVEPWFGWITRKAEERMGGRGGGNGGGGGSGIGSGEVGNGKAVLPVRME